MTGGGRRPDRSTGRLGPTATQYKLALMFMGASFFFGPPVAWPGPLSSVHQQLPVAARECLRVGWTGIAAASVDHHAWKVRMQFAQEGEFPSNVLWGAEVDCPGVGLDEE